MRKLMLVLHKYAGLSLGLMLGVIGISGSLLVFDHAIDEALTPEIVTADNPAQRAPLNDVLAAAKNAVDSSHRADRIYIARQAGSPHVVRFRLPAGQPGPVEVSVAPATAEVLAVRTWGEYPASWLYTFHYTLLAGPNGKTTVGLLGIVLLFFCVSGVIIWWPQQHRWRRALTVRWNRGAYLLNLDLHKTSGIYLLPILAVVSFSGVAIVFPNAIETMVSSALPMDQYPNPRSTIGAAMVPVSDAAATAATAFPDAELKRVQLPRSEDGPYLFYFNTAAEPWSNLGGSAVWVDAYSNRILATWNVTEVAAGSQFMRWQFPLHNGDALGMTGRWLVFIVGFLPALLFGTGVYMWWRKRKNRTGRIMLGRYAERKPGPDSVP
ncbi:PepSY-associated TM helix domain-containing protein [Woeseia oceani]|uniref:PepSY domain-containing protein n=1 Tax=Woeseia oceani TaxID=1548547 RepID=A0A193LJJ4_9GAMM|nr:PepSY-associated TM helix domain-containing protein [Woeseia oceani]ANO52569.1 hypothetical protein BA177_16485 [Woeseia oceani]